MNIETFIEKLKTLGIDVETSRTSVLFPCPLSDHPSEPKSKPPRITVGKTTKMGKCSVCGKEEDLDGLIIAVERSLAKGGTGQAIASRPRFMKLEHLVKRVDFAAWRSVIGKHFPDLLFPAEVGLSIIAQILIKDVTNPFALVLVDVPSSGKTITINFFQGIDDLTYASDKFTPAAFVSNANNVKKKDLPKIDLLPRLQYKMLLLRDLSTLFAKREEDLTDLLGLLTRVLDGEGLNTDSGVHGQRQYVGEYLFMILAGSTPIRPRIWNMMGSLGSRLFFLDMHSREKTEDELAEQLGSEAFKKMEATCRATTKFLLETLWYDHQYGIEWDKASDRKDYKLIISRCAKLLARLRGVIQVWKDRNSLDEAYEYNSPVIERADRINQLFYNVARGHAVACGRERIEQEDLRVVIELAIDSCMPMRAKLFRAVLNGDGEIGTGDAMASLDCSRPTAHGEMEKLVLLKICHYEAQDHLAPGGQEKKIRLNDEFSWFLSDECRRVRGLVSKPEKPTTVVSL